MTRCDFLRSLGFSRRSGRDLPQVLLSLRVLLCLAPLVVPLACASRDSTREPSPAGEYREDPENPRLHDWQAIYTSRVVGSAVERERIGFVELRYDEAGGPANGVQYFYRQEDPRTAIGFRLPSGETFRFKPVKDSTPTQERLGAQTLERATRLLFATERDLEFREFSES